MLTKQQQTHKTKNPKKNRLSKTDYKTFQKNVYEIGYCQICSSPNLDTPHHSKYGAYKDDKSLVCICQECHYQIHHGKIGVPLTRNEIEKIGQENWRNYENSKH